MNGTRSTLIKFTTFGVIMIVLTAFLFFIFGQYRTGSTKGYSAVFTDTSRLQSGDSVRVAGIRVGTVTQVALQPDNTVLVEFDTDRNVKFTDGTKVAVRYLNLIGDRYLDLIGSPGSTRIQPPGSQIPISRTEPALDLDLLLGSLKPVIRGLNPQDVNALTNSLIQVFQGQADDVNSLFAKTASFTNTLADNGQTVQQLIDNLQVAVNTIAQSGSQFSDAIDSLERLITGLSHDREPIGAAIDALSDGTASLADLLTNARPPLAGAIDQLNRLAPSLEGDQARIDSSLQSLPKNYNKLARIGSYGNFFNYYICGYSFRFTDLQGRTAVFPWFKQTTGRCGEP